VHNLLQQYLPNVEVTLAPYPPPPLNAFLSKVLGASQLGALALVFGGNQILPVLGVRQPYPQWYQSMTQNKLGSAFAVWVLGNVGHNMLLSTGAFEVSYDGREVFSKLSSKRMPSQEELLSLIRSAVEVDKHGSLLSA